jgi:hypothetical protein
LENQNTDLQNQVSTLIAENSALQAALEKCGQTDIRAAKADNTLTIYPNPTSGIVTIADVPFAGIATVYDLSGRIVMTFALQAGTNNINLSAIPTGTYTVQSFLFYVWALIR